MAKYTEGICADGAAILKDGHTMMVQDVLHHLNRKSFLEQNKLDMEKALKAATLEERARCAKLCDDMQLHPGYICAEAIRSGK